MSKHKLGKRTLYEDEHLRIVAVKADPSAPLSAEEVRKRHEAYFQAQAGLVGPMIAAAARDAYLREVQRAMEEAEHDDADEIIEVTIFE